MEYSSGGTYQLSDGEIRSLGEMVRANQLPKNYQGRDSKGRFGGGTRSGSQQSSSKPPERTSPDSREPSRKPPKAPGRSPQPKQSPDRPKMSMVHGKKDKIHAVLERNRLNPDAAAQGKPRSKEPYRAYRGEEVMSAIDKAKKNQSPHLDIPDHALAQHYELAKRHGYGRQADAAIEANRKANPKHEELHGSIQELAKKHGLTVSQVADGHVRLSKDGKSFDVKVSDDKSPKEFAYSSGGVHVSTSSHPEAVKQKLDEISTKAEALGAGLYVKGKTRDALRVELDVAKKTSEAPRMKERSKEHLEVGRQKLQDMRDHPTPEKIADFAAHARTMHPDDAKQLAREYGLRSKNGETLAKEAHIASQERSKWQQEARKNGIDVDDFKRQAIAIRNEYNAGVDKYNQAISSRVSGKLNKLADKERDYTSVAGIDKDVSEFATQHPELFHGILVHNPAGGLMVDPESGKAVVERYAEIMAGGKLPKMSKQQSYAHAFDVLYKQKQAGTYRPQGRRKVKDTGGWDDVPF